MMQGFIDFVNEVYPSLDYEVKQKAKKAVKDFEEMKGPHIFLLRDALEELSQGDVLSEMKFFYFDELGQQKVFIARAMVLSMSCDIDNNDMILLAPVLKLSDYVSDISSIVHNRTLTYLYYPDDKLKDYYIDFSFASTYSSMLIKTMLEKKKLTKIASLNQVGYYMFLCKLSIFMTRREDSLMQEKRKLS